MRKILNFFKFFSILTIFLSFLFGVAALFVLWQYSPELPSYEELKNYNPSLTTRVFTSDGLLLDEASVIITINAINDPPFISDIGAQEITEDELFQLEINAIDYDNDDLIYNVSLSTNNAVGWFNNNILKFI